MYLLSIKCKTMSRKKAFDWSKLLAVQQNINFIKKNSLYFKLLLVYILIVRQLEKDIFKKNKYVNKCVFPSQTFSNKCPLCATNDLESIKINKQSKRKIMQLTFK